MSVAFGKFASAKFPKKIQNIINKSYVFLMRLDMSSFRKPTTYSTLNALFTRELVVTRDIKPEDSFISPVDGLVTEVGAISDGKSYQIKDMSYDIESLLGIQYSGAISDLEDGYFANFYLSPRDYHRYHAPCDIAIKSITHIPGKLYPVNFTFLKLIKGLFIQNERVIIEAENLYRKKIFIVLVGALNVGKMHFEFDKNIQTNASTTSPSYIAYENLELKKGDLMGWFEMGSTLLIFGEKDSLEFDVGINTKVSFGQKIGNILQVTSEDDR